MEREEAVKYFQKEITRLRDEEHVNDLFKACCAEELAAVECRTTKAFSDYLDDNGYISLSDEEIADDECTAIALWGASSFAHNEQLVADVEKFAHRVAKNGGQYGKNIAAQVLDGEEIYGITSEDFFSDRYAQEYDEKYKFETE